MVDENLLKIMLAHASYSFAEIDWEFEQLTTREKSIVMNQENLDKIKKLRLFHSGPEGHDLWSGRGG